LAGGAGVKDHAKIGPGSIVGGRALVCTNVPPGAFVSGYPARPHKEQLAIEAAMRKLPDLVARINELEERIRELEKGH
ncbi:MAG: UDP-3-O-(3-hydroxymyristoyl)glucosamine N-acyltransferase, partial [Bacillota bacterium]